MDLSTNKTTCMLYVNFNCLCPANVGYVVTYQSSTLAIPFMDPLVSTAVKNICHLNTCWLNKNLKKVAYLYCILKYKEKTYYDSK